MIHSIIFTALSFTAAEEGESYLTDKIWSLFEASTYYAPSVVSPNDPDAPDSTSVPYTGDTVLASGGVENPAVTIKWSKTKKIYVPLWPVVGIIVLLVIFLVWRRIRQKKLQRERQTVYRRV